VNVAINRPRTTAKRLALNSVCSLSIAVTSALVSIFLTPFILSRMGDQRYGVWAVMGSVYAYSAVLTLGLYSAINRHIPVHVARGEEEKIREVASTTTAFFLAMGLLIMFVVFGCGDRLLACLVIPSSLLAPARLALYTVGIVAAVCLSLNSFAAVLSGYQRYDLMALGRLIAIGFRVGLVLAFLGRSEALFCMALIFGATESLVGLFNAWFAWRLMPSRPLRVGAIHWRVLREMFAYGVNTFIYAVGAIAVAKTGEVIVGTYLPPEHITYYTLALMPPMMLSGFVESLVAAIKPAVADLDTRNDLRRIQELTLLSQKYVLLFMVPAMAFFVILGGSFYRVWLHRDMNQALTLLYILAPGCLIHAAQYPVFLALAGRGEHRIFGILTLVMGLGAAGLGIFLCRVVGWGTAGVALGTTVAMIAVSGVVLPCHAAKRLGLALADFARRAWVPAAYGVSPAILLLVLWKLCQPPETLLELILAAGSTALVLALSVWFLSLGKSERNRFAGMAFDGLESFAPATWLEKITRPRQL
jgi:O-antigen/teichoic acid export membrane protein